MNKRFKPKFNIKKGDSVVVISGEDKDLKKPRKVLQVLVDLEGRPPLIPGMRVDVFFKPDNTVGVPEGSRPN